MAQAVAKQLAKHRQWIPILHQQPYHLLQKNKFCKLSITCSSIINACSKRPGWYPNQFYSHSKCIYAMCHWSWDSIRFKPCSKANQSYYWSLWFDCSRLQTLLSPQITIPGLLDRRLWHSSSSWIPDLLAKSSLLFWDQWDEMQNTSCTLQFSSSITIGYIHISWCIVTIIVSTCRQITGREWRCSSRSTTTGWPCQTLERCMGQIEKYWLEVEEGYRVDDGLLLHQTWLFC